MTTQEHIDGLIATIWHATENRSVTNVMVARVLDWLNRRSLQLQLDIEAGHQECRAELAKVREQMAKLEEFVKGTNTLASNAYGIADGNTRAIEQTNAYVWAIMKYLQTGRWPEEWESGGNDIWGVRDTDRGEWRDGEMYYNGNPAECFGVLERSHVWYFGCKFVNLRTGTSDPPRWNSPDWRFEEGDPELRLHWVGSEDTVMDDNPEITLSLRATLYNQDVTEYEGMRWDWSRESVHGDTPNTLEDAAWTAGHQNKGEYELTLAKEDMNYHAGQHPDRLVYTAKATIRDHQGQPLRTQMFRVEL